MTTCLLADIGATWARFAVLKGAELGAIEAVSTGAYAGPIDAIRHFLNTRAQDGVILDRAVIAAAGPVEGGRCALTNVSWVMTCEELRQAFHLRSVRLVNDLEALAWGVPRFAPEDSVGVGGGTALATDPVVLLAPGTGLGMACFIAGPGGSKVLASEGGHATLAATDATEAAVIDFLRHRYGHVSAERVLSGRGLMNLHEALTVHGQAHVPIATPEQVVREAIYGTCDTARRVLDMFCGFLGSVAGSAALSFGARGGVLIAGGIVPKIVDHLGDSPFRERFESKGRLQRYLARVPTRVVTRRDPTFVGLMALAHERG
ncbi:glucokinase [Reyranella sp.]|uniref:glucokinase n=1 Tax=Reyranella sp. TaxID=1929291 RepID=UPI003D1498ED